MPRAFIAILLGWAVLTGPVQACEKRYVGLQKLNDQFAHALGFIFDGAQVERESMHGYCWTEEILETITLDEVWRHGMIYDKPMGVVVVKGQKIEPDFATYDDYAEAWRHGSKQTVPWNFLNFAVIPGEQAARYREVLTARGPYPKHEPDRARELTSKTVTIGDVEMSLHTARLEYGAGERVFPGRIASAAIIIAPANPEVAVLLLGFWNFEEKEVGDMAVEGTIADIVEDIEIADPEDHPCPFAFDKLENQNERYGEELGIRFGPDPVATDAMTRTSFLLKLRSSLMAEVTSTISCPGSQLTASCS